jgi:hypothetical protein
MLQETGIYSWRDLSLVRHEHDAAVVTIPVTIRANAGKRRPAGQGLSASKSAGADAGQPPSLALGAGGPGFESRRPDYVNRWSANRLEGSAAVVVCVDCYGLCYDLVPAARTFRVSLTTANIVFSSTWV